MAAVHGRQREHECAAGLGHAPLRAVLALQHERVPRLHEHHAGERHERWAAAAHLGRKQGPPSFGQSGAEQAAPAPEEARGGTQSPGLSHPASGAALAGRGPRAVLFTVAAHDAQLAPMSVEPDEQLRERGGLPRLQGAQLDAGVVGPRLVLLLQSGRGHGGQLGRALDALRVAPRRIVAFLPLPVIPHLKITDKGMFDVDRFALLDS